MSATTLGEDHMTASLTRRVLGAATLTGLTAGATPAFAADVTDRVVREPCGTG